MFFTKKKDLENIDLTANIQKLLEKEYTFYEKSSKSAPAFSTGLEGNPVKKPLFYIIRF